MEKIRKVHLETLINALIELHSSGADYVDIIGHIDENEEDSLYIQAPLEYWSEEAQKHFSEQEKGLPEKTKIQFSDDDINQLI